jgi:hypothetical protein
MRHIYRGIGAAVLGVVLATGTSPALAKPPAKPTVTVPTLSVSKPGSAYDVKATWTASANTTKFAVKLIDNTGATLDSGTVTSPTWTGHTTLGAGKAVRVTVTPFAGTRKGQPKTSNSLILPDLTAPLGVFSVVRNNGTGGDVALHLGSLTDDVSLTNDVEVRVAWDEGANTVKWPAPFSDLSKVYSEDQAVHYVTVTVEDEAGNVRDYPLTIVVNDTEAPNGAFTVSSGNAWASFTSVSLSEVSVTDNLSQAGKVARIVNWGDGTATQPWTSGLTHKYAAGGTYTPKVTLIDEAGNSRDVETSSVIVKVDATGPALKVASPKAVKSVRAWQTVRGTAVDAGVGMRNVLVKAVEKRGASWYAFKAATRTWVKAGLTKRAALKKATWAGVTPTSTGAWAVRLGKLTKGTLVVQARAFDQRGNASALVVKKASLTTR